MLLAAIFDSRSPRRQRVLTLPLCCWTQKFLGGIAIWLVCILHDEAFQQWLRRSWKTVKLLHICSHAFHAFWFIFWMEKSSTHLGFGVTVPYAVGRLRPNSQHHSMDFSGPRNVRKCSKKSVGPRSHFKKPEGCSFCFIPSCSRMIV